MLEGNKFLESGAAGLKFFFRKVQMSIKSLSANFGLQPPPPKKKGGEAFLLTVGAFLLTVKLPCLQSLKALMRRTFPL